jgi:hypothetical protein
MELIVLSILLVVGFAVNIVTAYLLFSNTAQKLHEIRQLTSYLSPHLNALQGEMKKVHERIDKIFVIDTPQENEAAKKDDEGVEFSEGSPLDLSKDIKIEVEGGDTTTPPEFN